MIRPPFGRVYGNISGSRMSQFRPPRGLDRLLESIPPLRSTPAKLVSGISPPLLNRFSRFQRRCNLLIHTFPTVYNTTRFSKRITEEEQVNKKTRQIPVLVPQSRYRNVNNTVRIARINWIL